MSAAFTPGPWFVITTSYGRPSTVINSGGQPGTGTASDPPARHIARVADGDGTLFWTHLESAESIANAHLIAAAPELYEALRALISPEAEAHMREAPRDFAPEWPAALAALAKARGEAA